MTAEWNFLEGTYWYVPNSYLPALQMNAEETTPTAMIDQTLWQITGYNYGYFWGNCAALMYEKGTTSDGIPQATRFVGTITPQNRVQISFMPINQIGAAFSTIGIGSLEQKSENNYYFEMQMSSGITNLIAHWAKMLQTKEGDPSWNKLPGTEYSVPEMLEAAGFETYVEI